MPLINVAGTRSGDSLPVELRSPISDYCGTQMMPSLRLSASNAGLSGMSIHYGATEGPWGYRAYNWPPFGYRGLSGLSQGQTCIDNGVDVDGNPLPPTCFPSGDTGTLSCQPDDSAGLAPGQVFCSTGSTIPASSFTVPVGSLPTQTTQVSVGGQSAQAWHPPGYTGPLTCQVGATCQAPPGFQFVPLLSATGQMMAQILAVSQGQGVTTTGAAGTQTVLPSGTKSTLVTTSGTGANVLTAGGGVFSGSTGVILIAAAVVMMMMFAQSRKS